MKRKVSIKLGKPVVIAQSEPLPSKNDNWGPYQFPTIEYMDDGRLHTEYHIRKDSAKAYGMSKGHAASADNGKTWTPVNEEDIRGGLLLGNGDRMRVKALPAIEEDKAGISGEPDEVLQSYGHTNKVYASDRFPKEVNRWPFERLRAGEREWKTELKLIDVPRAARYTSEGVFPYNMFWRLRLDPEGRIWAIAYPYFLTGKKPTRCHPMFCISEDNGNTFRYLSDIPYQPIPEADPACEKRGGFGEPDVAFMPDGSVLCLLRTTDGHGISPSYICHSSDGGATWTKPEIFDDNGVWPTLLTLKNGVTLTCYGRPGLFLRANSDRAGREWDDRIAIVPPGDYQTETCSYGDLIALDDSTAYMVYSDFKYPNPDGIPVKSIMGIRIETCV